MATAVLMPGLTALPRDDGTVVVTRKFHEGVLAMLEHWDGPLRVLMEPSKEPSWNLDHVKVDPKTLPYQLELVPFRSDELGGKIRGTSVVLAMIGWQTSKVSQLCRQLDIPSIYFTEYTLKTRLQIARAEERSALLRARRSVFEINQERRNQAAIRIANGLQCNGTPTYDVYQGLNRNSHLFFDSRLRVSAAIDDDALERRLATLDQKRPLHLVFTGRLDPMKGVRHLPRIAHELRLLGVDFRLTICGDGTLTDRVAADIRGLGLQRQVTMRGVLDFDRELIPFVQGEADLFVSSHVQGDPSCTYIETFGCGVPMIGFGNEALAGMLRLGPVGWTVPMGDHQRIAEMIQTLDRDREQIRRASRAARTLALDHTFELMMQRRVDHMRDCAARPGK